MEFEQAINLDKYKNKSMVYEEEAKTKLKEIIGNHFRILGNEWRWHDGRGRETLIFDYIIPSGHIEFSLEISGWGHSVGENDNEAGA